MIAIAIAVLISGAVAWAAWEATLAQKEKATRKTAAAELERAEGDRIRTDRHDLVRANPLNGILPYLRGIAAGRVVRKQRIEAAEKEVAEKGAQVETDISGFKGGVEPNTRAKIVLLALVGLWLGAFVAEVGLNYPVFEALTGHIASAAFLTAMTAIPAAAAPLLYDHVKHTADSTVQESRSLRGTFVGVGVLLVAVVAILVWLAPHRAQEMYGDQIAQKRAQLIQARADGDTLAENAFASQLETLEKKEEAAADVFQGLAVLAVAAEFATGFAAISGVQVLRLAGRRRSLARAEKVLTAATNDDAVAEAEEANQLGRILEDSGVDPVRANDAIQEYIRRSTTTPPVVAPPVEDTAVREPEVREPDAIWDPPPAGPTAPVQPEPPRPTGPTVGPVEPRPPVDPAPFNEN